MRAAADLFLVILLLLLGACSAGHEAVPTAPPPTAVAQAETPAPFEPGPSLSTPSPAWTPAASPMPPPTLVPGDYVYLRTGFGAAVSPPGSILVFSASTGAQAESLPPGIGAPDWSVLYVVTTKDGATTISALDPALGPGAPALRQKLIQGNYQLAGGGLSPTGKYVVLAGSSGDQGSTSYLRFAGPSDRFVVLDTGFSGPCGGASSWTAPIDFMQLPTPAMRCICFSLRLTTPACVNLAQAASRQGRFGWQLVVYDVEKSQLLTQPLADQEGRTVTLSQRMAAVPSRDGRWVYSLETDASGIQLVYALDLATRTVRRVDLPLAGGMGTVAQERASLAVAPGGSELFVINSTPASIVRIATSGLSVEGNQRLLLPGALLASGQPAGGGGQPGNGGGGNGLAAAGARRALFGAGPVLSPDGHTLYLATTAGLAVVNLDNLSLVATFLPSVTVNSMVISPDGTTLYATSAALGQLIEVDARSGSIRARFGGIEQGWALLDATTHR